MKVPRLSLIVKNNTMTDFLQAIQVLTCGWFIFFISSLAFSQSTFWKMSGFEMKTQEGGVSFKLAELDVAGYQLRNINYSCPQALLIYPQHQCNNALIAMDLNGQNYQVNLDTALNFHDETWQVQLSSLNDQIKVATHALSKDIKISLYNSDVVDFFKNASPALQKLSGQLSGELLANTKTLTLISDSQINFQGFNYEHSDDVVLFGLGGHLDLDLDIISQTLDANIHINSGEMLFNELYVDYSKFPVDVKISASLNENFDYQIETKIVNQQSMSLQTKLFLNQQFEWDVPEVAIKVHDSHHFNQQILNSILGIYGFGSSQMSGGFEVLLQMKQGQFQFAQAKFNDYYALNNKRKIQVDALNGQVIWDFTAESDNSQLDWQTLLFAGMPVKASQVTFNVSKDQFKLLGKHEFPVFDGTIILKELVAESLFSESIDMAMNATVLPISLKLITEKLNWPAMSGTISGDLPGLVKKGSVIEFLGALNMSVFQGKMVVNNLSLERLFGVAPVIAADVAFEQFDLALLTETFGFGQITGKLSGVVNELRITNWKTDRLDAHVYTVKTKGVKQTISQRAIDNISSLGGIKGAISKTFLRFFDDFGYKRIELSCKLHNSVCQIGGLKNQGNQFVIVEGGGIPKINIVGFVRTINWEEFISRLLNANYDN